MKPKEHGEVCTDRKEKQGDYGAVHVDVHTKKYVISNERNLPSCKTYNGFLKNKNIFPLYVHLCHPGYIPSEAGESGNTVQESRLECGCGTISPPPSTVMSALGDY